MIGLILRLFTGGMIDGAGTGLLVGLCACCALCGLYKCASCSCRDCGCIKRCLLCTGVDRFEDFELSVYVHEASFTGPHSPCKVRVKAGRYEDETKEKEKLNFNERCCLHVEQGTEYLDIDLVESRGKVVLAQLRIDPVKELLDSKGTLGVLKTFKMKQKCKGLLNPRIKLTFLLEGADMDDDSGLIEDLDLGQETAIILRSHMARMAEAGQDVDSLSKLELACNGTKGPLDQFKAWGARERVWLRVRMPAPSEKKYWLEIYHDEGEVDRKPPAVQMDLMRVQSVQPDPGRDEVFIINYIDHQKAARRLTFASVHQGRNAWVELLTNTITLVREEKDARRKKA